MSDMTYKKITEVEQLSFLNDDAKLFINQDNAIKQYSAKQLLNEYVPEVQKAHQQFVTDENGNKIWEERSHWMEEQEDYLVNTSGSGKYIPYLGLHNLKPNKEYTVIHNDTEYKCISQEVNGTAVLGNLKYAGSSYEDTGEPFFFPGIDKGSVTFYAMFSEGGEHIFSIFGPVDIAKPLSELYMPQSVPVIKFASKGQAVIVEDIQNGCPTSWTVATIPTKISELNNDVKHATEEYVDTKVAELVDNAPETLNTLKEVADALNENASTAEALNQAIGNKVDKTDYPVTANPNQILTTNENGEKVWENKLAYYTKEEKLLIPETTVEATSTWMLHTNFEAQTGDTCRVILNGQTYTGSYYNANNGSMAAIQMTEGEGFPVKQFYVKFTNYSMSGPQLGFSGTLTVYVTTTVVKPIKTEFLGIPAAQGLDIYSAKIGNLNRLTASGSASVALNESTSTGTSSCSVNNGVASGPSSFAQGTGEATHMGSSAFGIGTTSKSYAQFVNGKNNIEDNNNTYAMIVGNGQSGYDENDEYYVNHANAYTLDWSGNARFAGDVYAQGTDINNLQDAKKLATEEYVEERYLQNTTAFNELADTVKGLDKYCAFMKQGDQIKLGNVQEYSKMQEMLSGANKFHATLAVSYVNEEGLLISETCYAKSVMAAIDMETGSKPYVNFSFETFDGETIKFRWNADNTISNVITIAAIPAEEAEV